MKGLASRQRARSVGAVEGGDGADRRLVRRHQQRHLAAHRGADHGDALLVDQRPLGEPVDRRQHVERLAQALVAFAVGAQPAAQRQGEGGVAVGRAGPRQPDHVVRVAGEAVQQDHRRIGRRAGLRLEEVAAQGHAVTGHLHLLGVGHFGQVVPAMRHLDRHAVGIAEGRPSSSRARSSRAPWAAAGSPRRRRAARRRPGRPGRGSRPRRQATARPGRRRCLPWPGA